MTSKGLKCTCTFLARWALLAKNDCKPAEEAPHPAFSGGSQALPFDSSADRDEAEAFDEDGQTIDDPDDFGLEEIDD
jgi:hypothetical protein